MNIFLAIILGFIVLWIICGLITLLLGWIYLSNPEDLKMKRSKLIKNCLFIVSFGFFGLIGVIDDIIDQKTNI
jgi:hypothetical protein